MTSLHAIADPASLEDDVIAGLRCGRKRLPTRLLYDAAGSTLYEHICASDAYYPARTELSLLAAHGAAIATSVGADARVIELGCGAPTKARRLLAALERPSCYIPVDLSRDQLLRTPRELRAELAVEVLPVIADYMHEFALPVPRRAWRKTLLFYAGSSICNFEPSEARELLARMRELAGRGETMLLMGADGTRDVPALLRAYDDEAGLTAAFDKNLLVHLNRTRGATFDVDAFEHRSVWNAERCRVEMHLVSKRRQIVRVGRDMFSFAPGEAIVTEHSYKHAPTAMQALLAGAGWRCRQVFTAHDRPVRLWLCEPRL